MIWTPVVGGLGVACWWHCQQLLIADVAVSDLFMI